MIHPEASPLAGSIVRIKKDAKHPQIPDFGGSEYRVEDWWDRVGGKSWLDCGNTACVVYAMRGLPVDDDVLYGKIGHLGHLVHVSEIE